MLFYHYALFLYILRKLLSQKYIIAYIHIADNRCTIHNVQAFHHEAHTTVRYRRLTRLVYFTFSV